MKMTWTVAALVGLSVVALPAAAAPVAGDLAFVAINADEDGFALASFVDLTAGTQLFVTDNEWNGSMLGAGGAFTSGEGVLSWTLGSAVSAGTVVRFSAVDSAANIAVSHGAVSRSGGFALSQTNESVYLYQDDGAGGVIPLAAIGYGSGFADELAGSGLEGQAVMLSGTVKFAEFGGDRSLVSSVAAHAAAVADVGQWTKLSSGDTSAMAPDLTGFAMAAPVPEPSGYAMLLAGLGMVSVIARRRTGQR
ncbi:PEP-CTERM sorting domain-containing protein [Denitromonas iodatirespirans]|uniref:PEP-CTERM sorting domain-containing protein n=1 Tax=Denitromonas iodatirespirans TaxID=2795389 RepID=A0A944DCW8_DENI1|nr:PEP-CTERM sorting domain-containing protein [Denitromonas iodatirespirans]MBT0962751.1 PEP-CTERM sorting domain-containing protein [Denitromonas iodatirespirans]